ncbi:tumor necrosis factor receptor superfamily member 14-like [Chanos chanos]|uniref:Tumor necrosis factor receptor superfamily member 14-like n=1 Tax=Chanos chanos TaxID=29144 RepID=A0A6J2WAS2_CHACN|nr:tumor necrosis factor receptor superfamily member 14-like [Chanos chanos]
MPVSVLKIYLSCAIILFHDFQCCIGTCGEAEYEVDGQCCPMCGPGFHVYRHCTDDTSTTCKPCSTSTFTNSPNGLSRCFQCTVCDSSQGLRIKKECTFIADTICKPREGYYCIDQHKHSCRAAAEHSTCKPGQYIIQQGSADTDTVCGDCVGETYSNGSFSSCLPHTQCESSDGVLRWVKRPGTHSSDTECEEIQKVAIILGVLSGVVIVTVGLACFTIHKRKTESIFAPKTERLTQQEQEVETAVSAKRAPVVTCTETASAPQYCSMRHREERHENRQYF